MLTGLLGSTPTVLGFTCIAYVPLSKTAGLGDILECPNGFWKLRCSGHDFAYLHAYTYVFEWTRCMGGDYYTTLISPTTFTSEIEVNSVLEQVRSTLQPLRKTRKSKKAFKS